MKTTRTALCLTLVLMLALTNAAFASGPSAAVWLMQVKSAYDTTTQRHSIVLSWRNGEASSKEAVATHYYVYRSLIGHNQPLEAFEKIATVEGNSESNTEMVFEDGDLVPAGYYYYVVGVAGGVIGDRSSVCDAVAPAEYCVNPANPIIHMMSTPTTVVQPGDEYMYDAFGQHRSSRVQGFVRYNMVEGPDGMTIDELTGRLKWTVPSKYDKTYRVKIRVSAPDESDAETFQEWSIRSVTDYELAVFNPRITHVDEQEVVAPTVRPNPTSDYFNVAVTEDMLGTTVSMVSVTGHTVYNASVTTSGPLVIPTQSLAPGVYALVFTRGARMVTTQLMVSR